MTDSLKQGLIGFGCAASALCATYPLETIARQFHVTDRRATARTLVVAMSRQGPKAFYRGLGSAIVTQPTYWMIYTPAYASLKDGLQRANVVHANVVAAWSAGIVGTLVSNPLWVVRQRMQTEITRGRAWTPSYLQLVQALWHENGVWTFFRGAGVTLVKNLQMAALMPLFEHWTAQAADPTSKTIWSRLHETCGESAAVAVAAGVAKIVSSTGVYPLDVIRTNLRFREGKHVSFSAVARELVGRPGGPMNLFRGLGWYWLSAGTMFGVMMVLQKQSLPR